MVEILLNEQEANQQHPPTRPRRGPAAPTPSVRRSKRNLRSFSPSAVDDDSPVRLFHFQILFIY
jgi:hypothetical protein